MFLAEETSNAKVVKWKHACAWRAGWARGNGMAGEWSEKRAEDQRKGFSSVCPSRVFSCQSSHHLSWAQHPKLLEKKQPHFKDRLVERHINYVKHLSGKNDRKERTQHRKKKKTSLEENIQRNKRKFLTCYYKYGFS